MKENKFDKLNEKNKKIFFLPVNQFFLFFEKLFLRPVHRQLKMVLFFSLVHSPFYFENIFIESPHMFFFRFKLNFQVVNYSEKEQKKISSI